MKPGLPVTPDNLLERMLDPQVKLGTSTPKADPSGDYAFAVFAKADRLSPGAEEALSRKALQLTGGPKPHLRHHQAAVFTGSLSPPARPISS